LAISEKVRTSRKDSKKAQSQRAHLIPQIRNTVRADGKTLVGDDDFAFSKHGSLFQHLTGERVHDIDIYVTLNGASLCWGVNILEANSSGKEPSNLDKFSYPLHAETAAKWMVGIVSKIVGEEKVTQTKRGALISGYGNRDYDIIPSFLFRKGENYFHVIPNGDVWESNPTSLDMQMVRELGKDFVRDDTNKILGFRDVVKLLKFLANICKWKDNNGISSFIIRWATVKTFRSLKESRKQTSVFNQKTLAQVIDELNIYITNKCFCDPYTDKKVVLNGPPINLQEVLTVVSCQ